MDDIDFPPWIATSPSLAMAAALGRQLQETYCPAQQAFTVAFRTTGGDDDGSNEHEQRHFAKEHHRAKLLMRAAKGTSDDFSSSSSSSSSDSDGDDDGGGYDTNGDLVLEGMGRRGHRATGADVDDDEDAFYSVASSSAGSEYDAMERPHLMQQRQQQPPLRSATSGQRVGGLGAGPLPVQQHATHDGVDLLHDARVQRLCRLSRINELCCGDGASAGAAAAAGGGGPPKLSRQRAAAVVALFALAVECRPLPDLLTRGFYTECSSLYTTFLALLRDGLAFHDGVDVEGFTACLVACGLKMRGPVEDRGAATACAQGGGLPSASSSPSLPNVLGLGNSGGGTPRAGNGAGLSAGRNIGLSGFDPRMIDAAIVDCIPGDIDACAGSPVALGALHGLACTLARRPVYLAPVLASHLHDLTDAFATSPNRRDLVYKKLLSLLLEAMSCSVVIDYERTNNWITAIIQEAYVVRGLFQKEILHARVVAATLTLLIRQYQEMAAEYAATCGNVEGMPDFSEGDQLIELVWRALQDALQGWADAPPTKPQTLYGANLRVVLESVLRTEVERLRCFHVITCASTAYQQKLVDLYSGAGPPPPASPTGAAPRYAGGLPGSPTGISSPVVPVYFPEKGKKRRPKGKPADGSADGDDDDDEPRAGYALYFPSDEEEVLRVRVMANIVRFLLLPTSVLNVLPPGEATTTLRNDLVGQCAHVLTIVSATEFARRVASVAYGGGGGGGGGAAAAAAASTSLPPTPRSKGPTNGNASPHDEASVSASAGAGAAAAAFAVNLGNAKQRAQFSNGYYRRVQDIVHELIRVLVKEVEADDRAAEAAQPQAQRRNSLSATSITAVPGSTVAAGACLQSLCASDANIRSFAVSEVTDAVVRVSGTAGGASAASDISSNPSKSTLASSDAVRAANLAPCFSILCDIVVPRQYSLTRTVPRSEVMRYAQLLCDTYTDALRASLAAASTAAPAASSPLPTAVMRVAAEAFWRLVVRVHERLSTIARDAVRLARLHQTYARSGWAACMGRQARRAAALERRRYVRLLKAENVSIRQLILAAMRCMLAVAWPGSGVLYQRAAQAAGGWGGERKPCAATEPGPMAATALTCIAPFLKPLSLLLALSTLFPIRSLRNKGLAAHAEHARFLSVDEYREQYLLYYYYRPTTKADDGEAVSAATVEDADALLDSSESRHYLSEFRSLWLLLTYYGFSAEALATAAARFRLGEAAASVFYDGERRLSREEAITIRHIAASAAPLLQMRSSDMNQSVADITSLERYMGHRPPAAITAGSSSSSSSSSVRKQLVRVMKKVCGGGDAHWEKLSAEELFLMRSLLDLEMLRASSGSIANLTLYLHFEVREFVASPAIKHVLHHVVSAVCSLYLETLRTFLPKFTYQLVATDIHQLVLLRSFSLASVREAAGVVLNMIIDAFPVFAAYSSGLQLLWAVINTLENGSAAQVEAFCRRLHFNAVPAVAADAGSDDRKGQVQGLVALAERWADRARRSAPLVLFQAAARFVVGQSVLGAAGLASAPRGGGGFRSASQLSGSRLAMKAAAEQTTGEEGAVHEEAATGVLAIGATAAPNYAQLLTKYSNAQGQVLAAVRVSAFAEVEKVVTGLLRTAIHSSVCASPYHAVLARSSSGSGSGNAETRGENGASRLYEAESLLCSSVALLTTGFATASGTVDLLRFVGQGPIRVFDNDYIRAATDCWSWLLANDRERFMVPLLVQLAEGLRWTVAQGLGIFDGARPSQNAEVQTGCGANADDDNDAGGGGGGGVNGVGAATAARLARLQRLYPDDYRISSPHKLLFAFIADTYVDPGSPWSLDPDVLLVLYNLATDMVQFPSRLSLKDASFSETLRMAVLVGYICRHLHMINTRRQKSGGMTIVPYTSIAVLRQRWYACLLQWFRKSPPSWYFAANPSQAAEELPVLNALVRLLRDEETLLGRATLGFIDFSVGVAGGGTSSEADGAAGPRKSAPVNVWGVASVVREKVEAIRSGGAADRAKGGTDGAMERLLKHEQTRIRELLRLMRVLVQHELVRLRVWQAPRRTLAIPDPLRDIDASGWSSLVDAAAANDPAVMVAMAARFPGYHAVHKACVRHVVQAPERFAAIPEAVDLYITNAVLAASAPKLFLFTNCTIVQALRYLDAGYVTHPQVSAYAIRSLLSQKSEYLIFYLPQLLQVLATDSSGSIQDFLLRMSHKSVMFCHQLLWSLQTEGEGSNALAKKCKALEAKIKAGFDDAQAAFYEGEFDYTKVVTSLSGELMSLDKPQRKPKLRLRLQDAEFHDPIARSHLYLPTDPDFRVAGVIARTAGAMQSAAKCPILVQFQCVRREGEDTRTPAQIAADQAHKHEQHQQQQTVVKACIFKMGDDCRQDQISLQLIGLMKRILDAVGVPSYLYPYRVVTTGQDSGIIEVVPKSMSRNEIGKLVESNLAEFYVQTFGHPESVRFHRARDNFVKSVASYSVVSFILNIKDRHNGNIMIDSEGHLVHIDFGFLFDTSPGGDINFESSPFKLTTEMIQLIGKNVGGSSRLRSKSLAKALIDEESYIYFKTLVNRCYLAVRQYAREICILVELMLRSGLPCFKPKQTIANLAKRLSVGHTEVEAAAYMRQRIHESRQNYRTVLYDKYQQIAEGIEM